MKTLQALVMSLVAGIATASSRGGSVPSTHALALDGHTVELPENLHATTVLVLGFSRSSATATRQWEEKVRVELAAKPGVEFYNAAMLAEVPSLLRGVVIRSIRKQVPAALQPRFLTLTEAEASWKELAGYSDQAPNAAYVMVLDQRGTVRWRTHENFSPQEFEKLSTETLKVARPVQ